MKAFTYRAPTSEEEAVKMLGSGALPLAGGTNLINLMKERVLQPETLVGLTQIKGMDKIEGDRIGANVRLVELLENEAIGKQYPALAQAVATVGTPQIRNMATLGGNICTRTPCWYYMREGFSCRRQGGAECAAKEGENEFHAIFGTEGPCVSVHGSSAAPALIALDAKVRIVGPKGARELPVEKFFLMPKEDIRRENVLEANEILTHVILGKGNSKSATYVVAHKASHDWPVGLASVALSMEGETCSGARICLGAVAPIPWRAEEAEAVLAGKRIDEAAASQAADAAVKGSAPLAQNGYKVKTTHTAVKRAVLAAATGKW